jgi:hypothetical protein
VATGERQITLPESPELAQRRCVRVLTTEGFKDIDSQAGGVVTAAKRPAGQWTKTHVVLTCDPDGEGTRITVTARSSAQSPVGLASPPAQRMVDRVADALEARS